MAEHSFLSDLALHLGMAQKLSHFVSTGGDANALVDLNYELDTLWLGRYNVVERVLPVTKFHSEGDVERIANNLELAPAIGPSNVQYEMSGIFYELALNAVQHSQSAVGEYAILQYATSSDGEFVYAVGIADCGMGIRASLRQNPNFADVRSDAHAISLATELHVTGTSDTRRGLGLDHVVNVAKSFAGNIAIVSGCGYWNLEKGIEIETGALGSTNRLFGTVVTVTLSVPPVR